MKMYYVVVFLILLSGTFGQCQNSYRFSHVGVENGLSQGSIYHMLKDSRGYMWLGTQDGINRFDGKNIDVYLSGASGESTNVQGIAEDKTGDLWIGSHKGLYQYIRKRNRFVKRVLKNESFQQSLHVFNDRKNNIFLLSENGLSEIVGNESILLTSKITYKRSQISSFVAESAEGDFWFLNIDKGLSRYSRKTGEINYYFSDRARNVIGQPETFNCITIDRSGIIWLGTNSQLIRFDYKKIKTEYFNLSSDFNPCTILDIAEDLNGKLWLATKGSGILIFDPVLEKIADHLNHQDDIPNSLKFNEVGRIFIDENNDVFANTDPQGLNVITAVASAFKNYSYGKNRRTSLSDYSVRGIVEDNDSTIWIGTELGGLNRLNPSTGKVQNYTTSEGLPDNTILFLLKDPENRIWVSTTNGLAIFSRKKNRFRPITLPVACETINILYLNPILLLLSTDKGLMLLDTKSMKILNHDYLSLVAGYSTYVDKNTGLIYISNRYKGIHVFKLVDGKLIFLRRLLSVFHVMDINSDKNGQILWASTDRGLVKFDLKKNRIIRNYRVSDGLHHEFVYAALPDLYGNLWLSTNRGLSRFNQLKERFDFIKEIPPREYNSRSALVTRSGDLYFGSTTGLDRIRPRLLKLRTDYVGVHLTKIIYDHAPTGNHSMYIGEQSAITLPFSSNTIMLNYAATDYRSGGLNRFRYFLKGYDRDTIYAGTVDQVRYAQLPSGNYEFMVQASDLGGNWVSSVKTLTINIQPPFWKSWWFVALLYFCISVLIFILARKYLNSSLKKQRQESNKKIFLEKERSRIARDMNDSLGSELFGLKLLGQAALLKSGKEDTNSYIQKIVDASKGISEKISEVIWLTDSAQDNVESLWNYIQKNALLYLKPSGIEYWFGDLPEGRNISISGERRHEILNFNRQLFLELTKSCDLPQCEIRFEIKEALILISLRNTDMNQLDMILTKNLAKLRGVVILNQFNNAKIQIPLAD